MSDERTSGDAAPADIASDAAITGPARHPGLELVVGPGAAPFAPEKEPDEFLAQLLEGFEGTRLEDSHGQDVLRLPRERLLDFATVAKEAGFDICIDVTAVDWYRHRRVRFELVVHLLARRHRRRLRLLVAVPEDDPTVPSIVSVWPGASFGEREVYDMFGIIFEGSPDPTRILMPDDWVGHPLRKDFGVGAVPVQFKGSHQVS
jgi:NADH-quinone oxidoreductase subunit C